MEYAQNEPTISVIIPAYNVAEYLDACMHSLAGQSHRALELILVDDGSTDETGSLCEAWAKRDARVKVYHKENGGQADARNLGLREALGEYIGFVDPDDVIDAGMYSRLLRVCEKHKADVAVCRFDSFGEYAEEKELHFSGAELSLSPERYLGNILSYNERYPASYSVCTRLYKSSVLKGVRFPVGRKYEDIRFSTRAVMNASRIAYLDRCLYHYRIRMGSTTHFIELFDKRLITDRMMERREQVRELDRTGHKDMAALARRMYYPELLQLAGENPYPEYDALIRETIRELKPRLTELPGRPHSPSYKARLLYKMCFPGRSIAKYAANKIEI